MSLLLRSTLRRLHPITHPFSNIQRQGIPATTLRLLHQRASSKSRHPFSVWSRLFSSHQSAPGLITQHDRHLNIDWQSTPLVSASNKEPSQFHYVWLRDNCQCAQCLHPSTRQKLISSSQIPLDIRPASISWNADGVLEIVWDKDLDSHTAANAQHISQYPADWLRNYCYSTSQLSQRLARDHEHVLWDRELLQSRQDELWIPYMEVMDPSNNEYGLWKLLDTLQKYGLALVRNVPTLDKHVEQVALRIGPIRETFYGRSWDVKSVPDAKNIAYTSLFLGLHMDLMYFESPPGLQFLHCLSSSVRGGHSIFLDCYKAVDLFKAAHPDAFETLKNTPVTFHYHHHDHYLRYRRPSIEVDDYNQPLHVFYAPPFQGPLEVEPNKIEPFYDAFKLFSKFMEDERLVYAYKLRPGDCVIFANRRVLHGRLAFNSTEGSRHLKGTYVDWDAMKDRLRVLQRHHQK